MKRRAPTDDGIPIHVDLDEITRETDFAFEQIQGSWTNLEIPPESEFASAEGTPEPVDIVAPAFTEDVVVITSRLPEELRAERDGTLRARNKPGTDVERIVRGYLDDAAPAPYEDDITRPVLASVPYRVAIIGTGDIVTAAYTQLNRRLVEVKEGDEHVVYGVRAFNQSRYMERGDASPLTTLVQDLIEYRANHATILIGKRGINALERNNQAGLILTIADRFYAAANPQGDIEPFSFSLVVPEPLAHFDHYLALCARQGYPAAIGQYTPDEAGLDALEQAVRKQALSNLAQLAQKL
jgi:hypothetical protein